MTDFPRVWAEPTGVVGVMVDSDGPEFRLDPDAAERLAMLLPDAATRARAARGFFEDAMEAAAENAPE